MRGILRLSAPPKRSGPSRVARVHRTRTTATLLVTVAVTALSGCVTVQRPPVSGPSAVPSRPSAPRPDGAAGPRRTEPQVVQAPAREALELIGPSRKPSPDTRAARPAPRSAPEEASGTPPRRRHTVPQPKERREPHRPAPRNATPAVPKGVPMNQQDVCALGRKYGGWKADSPQAVICKDTYGR